jgi:serine/threonine-protein kinase
VLRQVGRYQIHDAIAAGGMASVHIGRMVGPLGFSRTVAIKCLHPQFAQDGEFALMLLDEARLCARIHHPYVVPTLDVVSEGGDLLVVMEYVHGESLSRLVRASKERGLPIDPHVAAALMVQVLEGLHAAHEVTDESGVHLGLVHRDVSPQNVLVSAEGVAKVIDFGVAKALGRAQTTRDGQLKGKVAYMSPEQLHGDPVTRATDVFAASIVLWELLSGARLFQRDDPKVTLGKVLECRMEPPSQHAPQVDGALDAVVMKGLARDPAQRFAAATEMAAALEPWALPAPPSRVAAWVQSLCHEELTSRRARIAQIERSGSAPASGSPARPTPPAGLEQAEGTAAPNTASSLSTVTPVAPAVTSRPRGRTAAAAIAAVVVAVAGIAVVVRMARPIAPPAAAIPPASPAPTPTPMPMPIAAATASSVSVETLGVDAAARGSLVTSAAGPPPSATRRPWPARSAPAVPRSDNCSMPYVLDAEGHKHYKRECLREP